MGLSPDRDHRIRHVLNSTEPNPEVESRGIRDDMIDAFAGEGDAFPTAADALWPGRQFWRTDKKALYVYTGASTGWRVLDQPFVWSGPALVGASWDGVSPLLIRAGHAVVTASPSGTGNAPIDIQPFPNGLLFATIQLIETVAVRARVRWSGSADVQSTLSKLEVQLIDTDGANVPASSFHRLGYYAIGW